MDPLTQGLVGAVLPQAAVRQVKLATSGLLGFFAGMAADLDVVIRSDEDPLLFLEYHRQFTHSLIFIPLGGLLCALILHVLFGRRRGLSLRLTWVCCTLGYATHALLDACTTYGTQLFWPFSDVRVAWNLISIVDPLFTLPLLALVIIGAKAGRPVFARVAVAWSLAYVGLGYVQREGAINLGEEIARSRGHPVNAVAVKPSFGNLLVWKTIYTADGCYYVDAVRAGWRPTLYPGASVPMLDLERDLPWLEPGSQQRRDLKRFIWFSNGYVTLAPDSSARVADIRYSLLPNEIEPLWSLVLQPDAGPEQHAVYQTNRAGGSAALTRLWTLLSSP